jgi:acetolactate synthase-1/2/3 large subunit
VKYLFAVNGGHTWPILAALRGCGIKLIHMRHEQSCAYAADGWARTTGTPGVCSVTAGCGLTNAVTALCTAGLAGSAVVCVAGQHPTTEDGLGSFQEAYGSEVCRSFSKFTKRVLDWSTIEIDLRQAFRGAMSPPQGVAVVEIPTNILYRDGLESHQRRGAKVYAPGELRSGADPHGIEQAIEILLAAKRPLIAAGDGIFWSGAAAELREFVELTKIPVYARRTGQGAVAEDHPLAIRGPWKKPFTGRADAVLAIGFRFWSGENSVRRPLGVNPHATFRLTPRRRGSASMCRQRLAWSVTRNSFSSSFARRCVPATGNVKASRTGSRRSPTYGPTLIG